MLSLYSAACGFGSMPRERTDLCYCAPPFPAPRHTPSLYNVAHACHACTAGGNYPLSLDPADATHKMCIHGKTVFMANSGTHAADNMHECPAEYTTMSKASDCQAGIVSCAGECPCDTTSPSTGGGDAIPIDWLAGFNNATAQSTTKAVGQTLRFKWPYGTHNVFLMASEDAFNNCDFTGSTNLGETSAVDYKLTSLPAYFACSIGSGSHCDMGQKLAVTSA